MANFHEYPSYNFCNLFLPTGRQSIASGCLTCGFWMLGFHEGFFLPQMVIHTFLMTKSPHSDFISSIFCGVVSVIYYVCSPCPPPFLSFLIKIGLFLKRKKDYLSTFDTKPCLTKQQTELSPKQALRAGLTVYAHHFMRAIISQPRLRKPAPLPPCQQ